MSIHNKQHVKLNITIDELEEMKEWVESPSFKRFVDKILRQHEMDMLNRLGTTPLNEKELVIARAKLEGYRELVRKIIETKGALRALKEHTDE